MTLEVKGEYFYHFATDICLDILIKKWEALYIEILN